VRVTWLVDIATAIVAVCAVAITVVRLREAYAWPSRIGDWRRYSQDGNRMGPRSASVTIVEFADFQCPICAAAVAPLRRLRERYPHDIALVYRHAPGHEFSFDAAVASTCAAEGGRFEAFHDALFQERDSIGKKPWLRFAVQAGVSDTSRFERCLGSASAREAVSRDTMAAAALGVAGTPTFLINDIEIQGYAGPAQLTSYVAHALGVAPRRQ
jgi:protein-disulfide isomerase